MLFRAGKQGLLGIWFKNSVLGVLGKLKIILFLSIETLEMTGGNLFMKLNLCYSDKGGPVGQVQILIFQYNGTPIFWL